MPRNKKSTYLCHVLMVNATIISSVKISAEKLIATMCINSSSNKINAPYIITPPERKDNITNEPLLVHFM